MNKWDEKNYTKQKTNCSHNSEIVEIDTTKNMPSDLDTNGWIDIGWKRKCPKCNNNIKYSSEQTYKYANVNCAGVVREFAVAEYHTKKNHEITLGAVRLVI